MTTRRPLTFGERLFRSLLEKQQHENALAEDIERFSVSEKELARRVKAIERQIERNARVASKASAADRRRQQTEIRTLRRELASARRQLVKAERSIAHSVGELTRLTSGARATPPRTARGRRAAIKRLRVSQSVRRERLRQAPSYQAAQKAPPFYGNGVLQIGKFFDPRTASLIGRYNNAVYELFKPDGDKTAIDEFIGRVITDVNGTSYLLVTGERELRDLVNWRPIDYATQYLIRAAT